VNLIGKSGAAVMLRPRVGIVPVVHRMIEDSKQLRSSARRHDYRGHSERDQANR